MTDLLVLNTWTMTLVGVGAFVAFPLSVVGSFLLGRWAAHRWFIANGAELAESNTRERYKDAIASNAEKNREIERLRGVIAERESRIRALVAVTRGAQERMGMVAQMLTLSELEAANG